MLHLFVPQAKLARQRSIFGNGEAPIWKTSTDDLNSLGVGVTLYFRVLKYLGIAFAVMSLLVLPSMYLCATGQRIVRGDVLNLASVSLGNSGLVGNVLPW